AQNLRAGLPLQQAISRSAGPPARDRKRMTARLAAGDPLDEVLRNAPKWLPETDRYVLSSAAESGRLVEGLQILAEKHSFAAAQRAKAVAAMIYPLFVIHLGVILVPLRVAILEGVDAYLRLVGGILVPLW